MDIPIQVDLGRIAQDLQIRRVQVESVVQLLDEGNTVPFITRYRKERTGNLNEVIIREIQLRVQRLRELAERKETILKAIEAQGKLTPTCRRRSARPTIPSGWKTCTCRSSPRSAPGLRRSRSGPGAAGLRIWTRDETLTDLARPPQEFVNPEKGVDYGREGPGRRRPHPRRGDQRDGHGPRRASARSSGRPARSSPPRARSPRARAWNTAITSNYTEPVAQIPPHRVLAINRGDKEGPLKVQRRGLPARRGGGAVQPAPPGGPSSVRLVPAAAIDALDRLMLPSMEREVRRDLTEGRREARRRGLRPQPGQPAAPAADPQAGRAGHRSRLQNRVQGRRARPPAVPDDRPGGDLPPSAPESPVGGEGNSQGHGRQAPGRRRGDRQWHGVPRNRGTDRRDHRRGHSIQQSRLCRPRSPPAAAPPAAEASPKAPTGANLVPAQDVASEPRASASHDHEPSAPPAENVADLEAQPAADAASENHAVHPHAEDGVASPLDGASVSDADSVADSHHASSAEAPLEVLPPISGGSPEAEVDIPAGGAACW